jgi:hypothetical protein
MNLAMGPHVLAFELGWGHLQHHDQPCEECDGDGTILDEDADGEDSEEECSECDGEGKLRWGSFYVQDHGECDHCKLADVPIAEMFEEAYVCLPCYLAAHKRCCGCGLWATEYGSEAGQETKL